MKIVDDSDVIQRMQAFEGDLGAFGGGRLIDRVPHVSHFGLVSVPPIDSEVVLVSPGGDRTQTIAIGTNHQGSRPRNRKPGDSGLYDVRDQTILLSEDGITIDAAGLPVTVHNASKVRCECDVETTGDVFARADGQRVSLVALHDAYNVHAHGNVAAGSAKTSTTDHTA